MSLGFYVDVQRCIGCRTCQVACKDRHNLQAAGPRTRRVGSFECETYPEVGIDVYKRQSNAYIERFTMLGRHEEPQAALELAGGRAPSKPRIP